MKSEVIQIDVFTKQPGKGNPAGVVPKANCYSPTQMQEIAKKVGFNETVFICESEKADIRLRFFTPGHEMPLCGHATIAAIFELCRKEKENRQLTIETQVGIINVYYDTQTQRIKMKQTPARFLPFNGNIDKLCTSIGIARDDLAPDLPVVYGNTGTWTLIVPIKDAVSLNQMIPQNELFPAILEEMPKTSVHPFAVTNWLELTCKARHFSSPFSGTIEDAVTGTASGVMGAYLMKYADIKNTKDLLEIKVQQGEHVQRVGEVLVEVTKSDENYEVEIAGTACFNQILAIYS